MSRGRIVSNRFTLYSDAVTIEYQENQIAQITELVDNGHLPTLMIEVTDYADHHGLHLWVQLMDDIPRFTDIVQTLEFAGFDILEDNYLVRYPLRKGSQNED